MTNVLRIAHLRIAHHVCNPEVGKREVHRLHNYDMTNVTGFNTLGGYPIAIDTMGWVPLTK